MIAAPATTSVELLRFPPQSHRTAQLFEALQAAAPADVDLTVTERYVGRSDLLFVWGAGALNRFDPMARQLAHGGHVISFDLGYWAREVKLRVSIDAPHPQRWVMRRDWPRDRFLADRVPVSNAWNPSGPILVAGIGRKAKVQYGAAVIAAWEVAMMETAGTRFGRPIRYRRKQPDAPIPTGAVLAPDTPIDQVLQGASLLITWHSNVAVDAIRLGIPVICKDGAAAAVCASTFGPEDPAPLPEAIRDRFLANVAYFQWAPGEAQAFWTWLREILR